MLAQGVVSVRSRTKEREAYPPNQEKGVGQPLLRKPNLLGDSIRAEPIGAFELAYFPDQFPGRKEIQRGGKGDEPRKERKHQPNPFQEKEGTDPGKPRQDQSQERKPVNGGQGLKQASADDESQKADQFEPGIQALEQPRLLGIRFGKNELGQKAGHGFQGPVEKKQAHLFSGEFGDRFIDRRTVDLEPRRKSHWDLCKKGRR